MVLIFLEVCLYWFFFRGGVGREERVNCGIDLGFLSRLG